MGHKYTISAFKLVTFKYGEDQWFDAKDKAVLMCLCDHANQESGLCTPSPRLISAETCLSGESVKRAVKNLKTIGFITTGIHPTRGWKTYDINIKAIEDVVMAQNEGKVEKKPKRRGLFAKARKPVCQHTFDITKDDDEARKQEIDFLRATKPSNFSLEDGEEDLI